VREAACLAEQPSLNAVVDDHEARYCAVVHVSVAIALLLALVAPAVFDVQDKTVAQIAATRRHLVERAPGGKLTIPEMTGSTVTVTNRSLFRVQRFTPIIDTARLAIIGLGRIVPCPRVDGAGELAVRPVMGLSLTADHRFLDGEPSAAVPTALCERLEASLPLDG